VAGVLLTLRLAPCYPRTGAARLAAFDGGAAPENLTGELARFAPDAVVLVDAAHLGRPPGTVELVPAERIGGLTFSTHMLPATIVLDYVRSTTGARTFVLGIQLGQKDVMAKPSPAVVAAVKRVVAAFRRVAAAAE
jgi:hydrogenase 3 maturation protease